MSKKLEAKTVQEESDTRLGTETVLLDNDITRITEWVFRPGEQTGWHLHNWDYVTIQQSGGCLKIVAADGSARMVDYTPDVANYRQAPIEHNARNVSDEIVKVLEIEYKSH